MPSPQPIEILIVDDKPDKILALEAVLTDLGPAISIVRANSGREALRHLLNRRFAVILLDINMPGMDGFETAELIRQRKVSENTPIIFITALGDEPLISQGYKLGAVDYIHAPVVPDILRAKVHVFVELARKTAQIEQQARRLEHRAAQLSAMASDLAQAEQRERRRLARLLHDHLQQLLVAAKMRVSVLDKQQPAEKKALRETLSEVDRLLAEAIEASRTLTVQLSPPVLYDAGLGPALSWLGRQVRKAHGLEVDVTTVPQAEPASESVRILLFQAARELLFNTVKHAQAKRATVALERGREHSDVCLTISDDGAGFDPSDSSAPASGANGHKKTSAREGFGLFSIEERLALLDGRMLIESIPGSGTKITLIVPAHVADNKTTAEPSAQLLEVVGAQPSDQPANKGNGARHSPDHVRQEGDAIRILLVDDHEILRRGLAMLFRQESDTVVVGEASNGAQAIELVEELNPDIVVMDVTMPGMSGLEATRHITMHHPNVVVIALSMHEEEDMALKMREAGASLYLKKGGPGDALLAAIRASMKSYPRTSDPADLPEGQPTVSYHP